jgi:hypothetical protein
MEERRDSPPDDTPVDGDKGRPEAPDDRPETPDEEADKASEDSFPTSDPPSW